LDERTICASNVVSSSRRSVNFQIRINADHAGMCWRFSKPQTCSSRSIDVTTASSLVLAMIVSSSTIGARSSARSPTTNGVSRFSLHSQPRTLALTSVTR
jgi:hypothetical protein